MIALRMNSRARKPKIDTPDTFEARGVCVPFAHRQLRHIRARAEPGKQPKEWEALFADPSGESGRRMIMPWTQLPGWMQFRRATWDCISRCRRGPSTGWTR